ncbi:LysR family transcriptional regulator [Vibrio breoganii]|uniref:LysR family transcriptional regulator n=1 Tax=Vibrio breoganii TaxID=553239 RepID=A0ABX1UAY2_9VIBR|nr:LysR family transcriptional regulator [Vibrio breoganii]NMO75138.1 LysR family transcriptional regulator [Vibrio breoganii]NMR71648.1 LysR family transcriptional regulator [Vibrio breoganii]PMG02868.1 hypothetical protein BCV02_10195 [Vibrio breoganii]PMG96743.1 hypothetical protein BCU79_06485 [Vibrio breoganii]PML90366.1 hypothetical protein BCT67_05950 [Vibrio breoganii]
MASLLQLQAFVCTVEECGFKGAALKLDKRPSTIAELVGALEDDINLSLFTRKTRKLIVTEQGKALYKTAKATLTEADHFSALADNFNRELPSEFVVGIDSMLMHPHISQCYQAVYDEISNIEMRILVGDSQQIIEWLRTGKVEIGLVASTLTQMHDLVHFPVFNFQLVDVGPINQIANGEIVTDEKLRQLTQIEFEHIRDTELAAPRQYSFRTLYSNDVREMLQMVSMGLGWTQVPKFIAEEWINAGRIHEFSIEGGIQINWYAEVVHLSENPLSVAGETFLDTAMKLLDV